MGFVELLKKRAKESVKTIVLPETEDMRTLEATDKILKEGVAKIILIGNEEEINKKAAEGGFDISGAQIVDPETSDRTQAYIDKFVELRAKKGMTPEKAKECSMFMQRLPYFLKYLDSMDIYYFNPLNPTEREEPGAPEKEDVLQNG